MALLYVSSEISRVQGIEKSGGNGVACGAHSMGTANDGKHQRMEIGCILDRNEGRFNVVLLYPAVRSP